MSDYNSRLRKRSRAVSRILRYQFTPELYPRCSAPRTWWWHRDPNFGDWLTPLILPKYGIAPILKPVTGAELISVGSVLNALPPEFGGVVWGTGALGDETGYPSGARILALRGLLTWERVGRPEVLALGDPGLLARKVVRPRRSRRWKLGVIPHYTHRDNPAIRRLIDSSPEIKEIDVRSAPARVLRQISRCEAIVTTSLHGLIVADSYGIPAAWGMLHPNVHGGVFKFLDHESVVKPPRPREIGIDGTLGLEEIVERTVAADPLSVSAAIADLEESLLQLKQVLGDPVRPVAVWGRQLRA